MTIADLMRVCLEFDQQCISSRPSEWGKAALLLADVALHAEFAVPSLRDCDKKLGDWRSIDTSQVADWRPPAFSDSILDRIQALEEEHLTLNSKNAELLAASRKALKWIAANTPMVDSSDPVFGGIADEADNIRAELRAAIGKPIDTATTAVMSKDSSGPWTIDERFRNGMRSIAGRRLPIGLLYPAADDYVDVLLAAPAFDIAWSLVPEEIKQRIFDTLHKPDTEWVEAAIAKATA